uniref:Potassium channel domain-containing protein n=1 Tax=Panagrolaimus superbus TaxID=310955 RepID=A0A914Z5N6_9BILA
MDSNLSSISTWPRNQTPPRIAKPLDSNNANSNRAIFTATLANLKQYAKKHDSQKARELIQAIQNFLSVTDITDYNNAGAGDRYQSNTIREEPHFDSMILCDTERTAETRRIDSGETNISNVLNFPVTPSIEEESHEPVWIRAIPQILLTFLCISYLIIGAWIYQYYDPELAKLPFHTVLTLTFQICTTLGWGNFAPTDQASRFFTLPYAVIGIPLTFACTF